MAAPTPGDLFYLHGYSQITSGKCTSLPDQNQAVVYHSLSSETPRTWIRTEAKYSIILMKSDSLEEINKDLKEEDKVQLVAVRVLAEYKSGIDCYYFRSFETLDQQPLKKLSGFHISTLIQKPSLIPGLPPLGVAEERTPPSPGSDSAACLHAAAPTKVTHQKAYPGKKGKALLIALILIGVVGATLGVLLMAIPYRGVLIKKIGRPPLGALILLTASIGVASVAIPIGVAEKRTAT